MNKELLEELESYKTDKYVTEQILEIGKKNFAEEITKYNMNIIGQPVKRKFPLSIRIKIWFRNFKNKLFMVFLDE